MPESQVKRVDVADKTTLDIVAGKVSNLSSAITSQTDVVDTIKANIETSNTSISSSISDADDALDSAADIIQPKITVIIESGSSVTATKGTTTVTGTSVNNKCELILPEVGMWSISATKNYDSATSTVELTNSQWSKSVYFEFCNAQLVVWADAGSIVTITHNGESSTRTANSNGKASFAVKKTGYYLVTAIKENASSNVMPINLSKTDTYLISIVSFRKLNVQVESGASVTISNGTTNITFTSDGNTHTSYIPSDGTWTVTATLNGKTISDSVTITSFTTYTVELAFPHIYGVEWDGSSNPQCTRTDESALFSDPEPYMAGTVLYEPIPGSSPFDTLMPWSGMVKETINGDVFVKIPKFWFKVTTTGTKRKIQIADKAVTGFSVSPAHQDRGDGKGERDYVYVSRYHVSSGYKSVSGVTPLVSITRSTARTGCSGRGTGYCQFDIMTLITIWYLYLVEFAHWDSQAKIGYGCGNGSGTGNLGASDSMPYHTGTMQSARSTYGVGTQYRWIEDLWGNVNDWVDGIYFSSANIYAIKNPVNFSDTSGGTLVGTRPTSGNEIKAWQDSTVSGYEWFTYPSEVYDDSNYATYCCDRTSYSSSGVVLFFGGCYNYNQVYGLFCLLGSVASSGAYNYAGARLLYLP